MFSLRKSVATLVGLLLVSVLLVCLIAIGTSAVQNQKKNQLEGVWKVVEVVPPVSNPSEKATPITNPQPARSCSRKVTTAVSR